MRTSTRVLSGGLVAAVLLCPRVFAAPVINEIHYRPGTGYPENTAREYIEIHNPDAGPVSIGGWAITSGVSFTFPAGTTIPAGGYVVVASSPSAVQTAFGVTGVLGPWLSGAALSNNREKITLSQPGIQPGTWDPVDSVTYATHGDWAQRVRESAWGGWAWTSPASDGGKSIELRNPALSNDNGQNWLSSTAASGGTPGAANSVRTANIPPVIKAVKHSPAVPRSTESVTLSCELNDETLPAGLSATLFWRDATTAAPGAFQQVSMAGDGSGKFTAVLPPKANLTIIEWYLSATDGVNTRTWPAPTSEGQNANCQYQVDDEPAATDADMYRLVLTKAENDAFNNVNSGSDRQFNVTFVAQRGGESNVRYRSSMRIRGKSSRGYIFRPVRMSLPNDDPWDGETVFSFNPKYPWLQYIGMRLFQAAGLPAQNTIPIELRRNGAEQTTNSNAQDFGKWVRVEDEGAEMVDNHWPLAGGGNMYKNGNSGGSPGWRSGLTPPSTPDGVLDGWTKQNNNAANDWTDYTNFCTVWQSAAAPHFPGAPSGNVGGGSWNGTPFSAADMLQVETVADLDHWARWFAVMTILQDLETNISNGRDDDYSCYFAPAAGGLRRMQLLPHDMDTILGQGDAGGSPTDHGLYDQTDDGEAFAPLLPLFGNNSTPGNPVFLAKYHTALRELFGTVFNTDTAANLNPPFYAFIDNHLTGWVSAGIRTSLKDFVRLRQTHLLGLIGGGATPIVPPAATATASLTSPHGALAIHEVLANNTAAHANGTTFPDVVEIRNTGASVIDLTGKSLSDDPLEPAKFVFGTASLAPGAIMVLYADSDVTASGTHLNFQLDQDGDKVILFDSAANGQAQIDAITFGPQPANFSIARTGAALDIWALCVPTIGAANGSAVALAAPAGVRINEWLSHPDYRFSWDWLELHNPAAQPVALGAMRLTDDFSNFPSRHTLPPLSFIGPGSFLRFKALGGSASPVNPVELPFGMDSTIGWLALIGQNGTISDRVDIVSQFRDASTGRSPDGNPAYATFGITPATLPSPGLSNINPPPAAFLALMNNLRITELMYKPNGGGDYEFIELQNIGTAALDLSGVRFTNGLDYEFPAGTTPLAAGAFSVVVKNRETFLTRYPAAAAVLAPGFFTGALDNNGETIAVSLPKPWDVAILNFVYETTWYPETFDSGYSLTVIAPETTPARDWNERKTWSGSPTAGGTPGSNGPPTITSPGTTSGIMGEAFSYQITATKGPTQYTAIGLPPGVTLNTGTGLISGTPLVTGTFNVTVTALNSAGSDTDPLVITVSTSGPMHHFTWSYAPATANAGFPFAVRLTARDVQERLVTAYNGTVPLAASAGGAPPPHPVVFTEVTDENEDQFELQNISSQTVNTAGWKVVLNDGTNQPPPTFVKPQQWTLPASVLPGQTLRVTEISGDPSGGRLYYGAGISWQVTWGKGWVMLLDGSNTIQDFFAWGWTAAELSGLTVTAGTATITVGSEWTGAGTPLGTRGDSTQTTDSWQRGGTADSNGAGDWTFTTNSTSWNVTNPGLTVPWNASTPLTLTPASAVFTNGEFSGFLRVGQSSVAARLSANDGAGHTGDSAAFIVNAALADADGDGLPDTWESANGLNPTVNDSASDSDNDGWSARAEFWAGTNPRSFASTLAVQSWSAAQWPQINLSFMASPGSLYRVTGSTNLTSWSTVPGTTIIQATAGMVNLNFQSVAPAAARAFYRVELLIP